MKLLAYLAPVAFLCFFGTASASAFSKGAFTVASISSSDASSCDASDGAVTVVIDAADAGTAPYDLSLDNGATWVLTAANLSGANALEATGQRWGSYAVAVRDASGAVVYPGYAQVGGCRIDLCSPNRSTVSVPPVSSATGYVWTTSMGSVGSGQGTPAVDLDLSGLAEGTVLQVCVQPTGSACTVPPTCLEVIVDCYEVCGNGIDDDNDGTVDCPTLAGRVFEDVNYGGGRGRDYATADAAAVASGWAPGAIGVAGARVELFDASGEMVSAATTGADGRYAYPEIAAGDYTVRVATQTVRSNRSSTTSSGTVAVQTARAVAGTLVDGEVGGRTPALVDASVASLGDSFASLTAGSAAPHAYSEVRVGPSAAPAADFGFSFSVVTNTLDAGQGSLRQWVTNAQRLRNARLDLDDAPVGGPAFAKTPGTDVSVFALRPGDTRIALLSGLPAITADSTVLTGYTQPGATTGAIATRTILVEVTGDPLYNGVLLKAGACEVSGLSIHNFGRPVYVYGADNVGSKVWGNFVGVRPDGVTAGYNRRAGIMIENATGVFVGCDADGFNDAREGNLVAGSYEGVTVRLSDGVLVAGNFIGTDRTGTLPLPNRESGIHLRDLSSGRNLVGYDGRLTAALPLHCRNLVGGNQNDGVRLSNASAQQISGNFIGTDRSGGAPVGNHNYGVQFAGDCHNNTLGTFADGIGDVAERNIISGNGAGVRFISACTGDSNTVSNNYVGVDVSGLVALPNDNVGLVLDGKNTGTIIGTDGDGRFDEIEGNIFSANLSDGVRFGPSNVTRFAGNKIGVGADGTTALPNGQRGIFLASSTSDNIIGYHPSMSNDDATVVGNIIHYANDAGIAIAGSGKRNRFSRNSYAHNRTLGIDLGYDLVTPNDDGDLDAGSNDFLNYPVISYAKVVGQELRLKGWAPAGVEIELYIADGGVHPDPLPNEYTTSFGEGERYFATVREGGVDDAEPGSGTYVDDGTGSTSVKTENAFDIRYTLPTATPGFLDGAPLTAIGIDALGNTSEFSGVATLIVGEICDDGVDNDGDGLVDCDDDDCPKSSVIADVAQP